MSVFLKRQQVRRERAMRRFLLRLRRGSLAAAFALGGLVVLYGFYLLVFFGPFFTVREVTVHGEMEHLSVDDVARLSGVQVGDNLFWLNIGEVRARLASNPWVNVAAVRRRPPHILWIYVEERKPVAILAMRRLFFVDAEGEIFKPVEPKDMGGYPVFTGMVSKDEKTHQDLLRTAIGIATWFDRSAFAKGDRVAEVNYNEVRGFSIITAGREPFQLVLGKQHLEERMKRVDQIASAIRDRGSPETRGSLQYVMVGDKNRIVVRYRSS